MFSWYKNSIIYSVHVESFRDGNGDGIGDLQGLTQSLGYLQGLGIGCLWLLPIFDSPFRDNGYDVRDYFKVHPHFGDLSIFSRLLEEAESRSLRILLDLPLNHTSRDHPWFLEARRNPDSPYHDYYIWCQQPPSNEEPKLILGEQQGGNWTFVPEIGKYYYHTFYAHEPDLNFSNSSVLAEVKAVMRFWLRQGIAGFRFDAVAHIIREKGNMQFRGQPQDVLKKLKTFAKRQNPAAIILAEVDEEPEQLQPFFGSADGIDLILNFYICNYLYFAFADENGKALSQALRRLPRGTDKVQWANFLRNHDELDLERLEKSEFNQVMQTFAPEQEMRLFGRGIRRRLAPMLQDNRARLELAFSLLFTLPGVPVLLYGDEIAMGDNLDCSERESVRLLMQWSQEVNGGFSAAPAHDLVCQAKPEGRWGYKARNVMDQQRDAESLLSWIKRLISIRHTCPEFGEGSLELIECADTRVCAYLYRLDGNAVFVLHNLGKQKVLVKPALANEEARQLLEIFGDSHYPAPAQDEFQISLKPYGYRWFRKARLSKEA